MQMEIINQEASHNIVFHLIIGGNTNTHSTNMDKGVVWGVNGKIFNVRFKEFIFS